MPQSVFPWLVPSPVAPRVVPPNLGTQAQWVCVGSPTYSTFATAATTNTISLFILPPAAIIHGIKILPTASFTGGGISGYTVSVGDGSNNALYASAFNCYQAPGADVYQLSGDFGGESLIGASQIYATATSTGANLSAATTGSVEIFAYLSRVV